MPKARRKGCAAEERREMKLCVICGRTITWRSKFKSNWDQVKFCSKRCRSNKKMRPLDRSFEKSVLETLADRSSRATICPSEVTRKLVPGDWKAEMEPVRQAVRRLAAKDFVEVRQKGNVVDPFSFRGPIRVGRGPKFDQASVAEEIRTSSS